MERTFGPVGIFMIADIFRDRELIKKTAEFIRTISRDDEFTFMHVCGTHEQAITKFGLRGILPKNIGLISGPGCPVCITPAREIDEAVFLAETGKTVLTYGDMFRVPGTESSLADAKARGGKVKIVYGIQDAVDYAIKNPQEKVVFFSLGLDTTVPGVASCVKRGLPENISLLTSHRLTVPAMELLISLGDLRFEGFLAPGHVSTIIGLEPYEQFPAAYEIPVVVAGFEPLDVMQGVAMLVKQMKEKMPRVENQYSRSVAYCGNTRALEVVRDVFEIAGGDWRGIGRIPGSNLVLRDEYSRYDARKLYDFDIGPPQDIRPGCSCHVVIIGKLDPKDCKMFSQPCTPEKPYGPCMVSSEGSCNIAYKYGGSI